MQKSLVLLNAVLPVTSAYGQGTPPLGPGDHTRKLTVKGRSGTEFYSVEHSIHAWVKANGSDKQPVVTTIPDMAKDGTTLTRTTYGSGDEGTEVVLVVIEGGGHTWPGQMLCLMRNGSSGGD